MSTAGNEGQRLAKLYAEKTDEELEELADSADSLTDIAKGALKGELSRRKLDIRTARTNDPRRGRTAQGSCATAVPRRARSIAGKESASLRMSIRSVWIGYGPTLSVV